MFFKESEHSSILASLSTRLETAEAKIASAENGRKEAIECQRCAEAKAMRLEDDLVKSQNDLAELSVNWVGRREYEDRIAKVEELEAKASAQKERIAKLIERNETMRLELEQLKSSLLVAEKSSNEKDLSLQMQKQQMEDAKSQLELTKGKLAATQRSLEESEKKVQKLGSGMEMMTAMKTKLEADLKKFNESEGFMKEKKMRLEAERKIETLQKEKKRTDEAFLYLQEAIDSLEKDVEVQKSAEARRSKEFEEAQKSMMEKLKAAEGTSEKLKHQSDELEKVVVQRDEEIQVLLAEIEQLEQTNQEKMQKMEQFFKSMAS